MSGTAYQPAPGIVYNALDRPTDSPRSVTTFKIVPVRDRRLNVTVSVRREARQMYNLDW